MTHPNQELAAGVSLDLDTQFEVAKLAVALAGYNLALHHSTEAMFQALGWDIDPDDIDSTNSAAGDALVATGYYFGFQAASALVSEFCTSPDVVARVRRDTTEVLTGLDARKGAAVAAASPTGCCQTAHPSPGCHQVTNRAGVAS